ncbi:MAG: isoleucine--tRNA ligase [Chitinophagales bacterium]|nr:isoleucine--tRNA ligase [Chitinophagales bacterium]
MSNTNNPTPYNHYPIPKRFDPAAIEAEILEFWNNNRVFEQSIEQRDGAETFVFYEGPPSVNGLPGIHHVMSRTLKDLFCRYHSLKGKQVSRKGGWDTHGLPIELAVEKALGITKDDIGTEKISIEVYNRKCREEALRYIDIWNDLTLKMGYWVDLGDPYITFADGYIESIWTLLKMFYDKGLLYKGYTIQPYSPAAGTGLSSHELNQPGCYREVSDLTAVAQFKVVRNDRSEALFAATDRPVYFLAWTTTPWTLPSNTALCLGANIEYYQIDCLSYDRPVSVILAKECYNTYFKPEQAQLPLDNPKAHRIVATYMGSQLNNIRYEQLLPYAQPNNGDAFRTLNDGFVTTTDGTGIVHIAPSFGADDMRVAKQQGIGSLTLVNLQGRFTADVSDFALEYVKTDYLSDVERKLEIERLSHLQPDSPLNEIISNIVKRTGEYLNVDERIALKLQLEGKLFKKEKYKHNYPHCWRTDKSIIYYPLDSWFIRTTACKDRLVALNKTIYWKPESTGIGRFGNWLENVQDWNLSRSRYWGTPLPIWRTRDGSEEICIGSIAELIAEIDKAVAARLMDHNPYQQHSSGDNAAFGTENGIDLHRPYIDHVVLVSPQGKPMYRETDLIDVWFDSGSMPYAQWGWTGDKHKLEGLFPADFIAEGVDQTRGWFYTLHTIAGILFDSVAFKTCLSTGLLLDKTGIKMSKRLGNVINPFDTINTYGADATRWYIISNASPWDNLKFDLEGVQGIQRKFFGTLFNTYSFFAQYANIDNFKHTEPAIPIDQRPEIDRWILSLLNSLIQEVDALYADYEPTRAARLIQDFVDEHLSNWYVRLCRRRFWKGEYNDDKIAAYQTLYECLEVVCQLMCPIAPFVPDYLFQCLNSVTQRKTNASIHLTDFPSVDNSLINKDLEERMELAQDLSSLVLALRKKTDIKVRQPLQKILVPILNPRQQAQIERVKDLILSETNVKELEYVSDTSGIVTKSIKPDFKVLGKKIGKHMKAVGDALANFEQADIARMERDGYYDFDFDGTNVRVEVADTTITSQDIAGWLVNSDKGLTVALDINLTADLLHEGLARELVNRIQNLRKQSDFDVTDRISVQIEPQPDIAAAIQHFNDYICAETLATQITLAQHIDQPNTIEINGATLQIGIAVV